MSILVAALSRGLLADYVMGERVDRRVMVIEGGALGCGSKSVGNYLETLRAPPPNQFRV